MVGVHGTTYRFFRHPEYFLAPAVDVAVREMLHEEEGGQVEALAKVDSRRYLMSRFYRAALASCIKLREATSNG